MPRILSRFQSTHPHGVRHSGETLLNDPGISIHAPARGATRFSRRKSRCSIFQSTHPHGVRPGDPRMMSVAEVQFQSTHPHGVRQGALPGAIPSQKISIHAPARGATSGPLRVNITARFQSTHPHGVRPAYLIGERVHQLQISIHAPARGATLSWAGVEGCGDISIHAPARGATRNHLDHG